jgi:hypothetical protein
MKPLLLSLLTLFPLSIQAGIEFTKTALEQTVAVDADSAEYVFPFKITGDKPVQISNLEVSCGCLEASVQKTQYEAGESGEVKIIFKVGAIEGKSMKPITVTTNDPKAPSIQLDCTIEVPKIYEFTPQVTSWEIGEEAKPKIITMKVLTKDPVHVLKYASTQPNMIAEMTVVKPGREYTIKLTPRSTAKPELGLITLETDCKIAKYTKRQVFFTISKKREGTAPSP